MNSIVLFNLVMAMAISAIIVVISVIKNPVLKAIVYSLPIPITLALIASQKGVGGTHIIGLCLLVGFLWLMHWLRRAGLNVLVADIVSALVYVAFGFILTKATPAGSAAFVALAAAYPLLWAAYMQFRKTENQDMPAPETRKVALAAKGVVVFVVASLLLMLKEILKGVIVTFPFSGVFAVIEMQGKLHTLASEFTKNSIAIWAFFVIVYVAMPTMNLYVAIVLGWVGYVIVLKLARKIQ